MLFHWQDCKIFNLLDVAQWTEPMHRQRLSLSLRLSRIDPRGMNMRMERAEYNGSAESERTDPSTEGVSLSREQSIGSWTLIQGEFL